jgi:hypothetical protein
MNIFKCLFNQSMLQNYKLITPNSVIYVTYNKSFFEKNDKYYYLMLILNNL